MAKVSNKCSFFDLQKKNPPAASENTVGGSVYKQTFCLFIFQIFVDTFCTSFTCTHGKDYGSCTCNGITTGIYAVLGCLTGFFLGNDTSSLVDVKALGCGRDQRVR